MPWRGLVLCLDIQRYLEGGKDTFQGILEGNQSTYKQSAHPGTLGWALCTVQFRGLLGSVLSLLWFLGSFPVLELESVLGDLVPLS